ncbi:sensor histidine kinase [Fictibacillus fluitans]|uniref:histidine kinase n=1 Tax=Fictibacillus fluitans TaxID=3058422 RepID=A0ABT8HZ93_9BACL|nr:HAMP domain-containing sensor histidine kinase [Fictibacillus sp. NE201]MDN4526071.1 HAMP domain-containing sensor histidine kinase [Fictibacillus sp. NE201]
MKTKFMTRWNPLKNMNLFSRTQWRLTMIYTGILLLFLILFMVIVYFVMYGVIVNTQENQLKKLVDQEVMVIKEKLIKGKKPSIQNFVMLSDEQFFYYVVDAKGKLLTGDELYHKLRPKLYRKLEGWNPDPNEIKYEKLNVSYYVPWEESPNNRHIDLMMAGRKVYKGNEFIGTLYVGKSISNRVELFDRLLNIFAVLLVVFAFVAFFTSYFMSRRAMSPIMRSYMKQRQFAADASHELRTPLSVLLSSINALEMERKLNEDEFSHSVVSNMKYEVKRMIKLVGDLLTLARSDAENTELAKEVFNFQELSENVMKSIETLAGEKRITLKMIMQDQLFVFGNRERLDQLLYILLENAIKYSPEKAEILLESRMERKEKFKFLVISVEDEGIGIQPEERAHIFERFYRTDKSRSKQFGGHGLGLSIAKWIVDSHGGSIHVEGKQGKGSVFKIKIPQ